MTNRLITLVPGLLTASAALGDSIVLLDTVQVANADSTIRLSDVARLDGDYAAQLGTLELGSMHGAGTEPLELHIGEVRSMLDEHGVHWGRITLSGRTVRIRSDASRTGDGLLAMQPLDTAVPGPRVAPRRAMQRIHADAVIDQPTLRGWLSRRIATVLDVDADRLQLDFSIDQNELLDTPLGNGQVEIKLLNSPLKSNRLEFEVRRWNDGTPLARDLVSIAPTVRTTVSRLRTDVPRGRPVLSEHVESVEQWMSPLERHDRIAPESIDGRAATVRLRAGTLLRTRDLKRPVLVQRGDAVRVSCLVGGAVMTLRATAESSGVAGDSITLRKGRERETFTARITARGEAVLELDGAEPATVADASSGARP